MSTLKMVWSLFLLLVALSSVNAVDPAVTTTATPPTCTEVIKGCTSLPCGDEIGKLGKCLADAKTGTCNKQPNEDEVESAISSAGIACADTEIKAKQECLQLLVPCTKGLTEDKTSCTEKMKYCITANTVEPKCEEKLIKQFFDDAGKTNMERCRNPTAHVKVICTNKTVDASDTDCYTNKTKCIAGTDIPLYMLNSLCQYSVDATYNENDKCTWGTLTKGMEPIKALVETVTDDCTNRKKAEDGWVEEDTCKAVRTAFLNAVYPKSTKCSNGAGQLVAPTAIVLVLLAALANIL